jgi:hypothetical protein
MRPEEVAELRGKTVAEVLPVPRAAARGSQEHETPTVAAAEEAPVEEASE